LKYLRNQSELEKNKTAIIFVDEEYFSEVELDNPCSALRRPEKYLLTVSLHSYAFQTV